MSNMTVSTDQYLVWEHGSFWDRTDFAPAAAAADDRPSSHSHPAEEASEVDPPPRRSLVRCESRSFSFHDSEDRVSSFYHLKPSSCFCSVWWEAGIFGEHEAEPSAAHRTRRSHQPGRYRNVLPAALGAAAGDSERRRLRGFLPGKDRRGCKRV